MSDEPMLAILNAATGEIERRPMTPAEKAQQAADIANKPVQYSNDLVMRGQAHTTDATPTQIWRSTIPPRTGAAGQCMIIGVDSGNGNVHVWRTSFAFKRLNAGALIVGTPFIEPPQTDAGASTWEINAVAQGNDIVVTVAGAAGRPVDWQITGSGTVFAPHGLT
jgi:hypothetical protein